MLFSRFCTFVVLFQIYNFQFVLAKEPVCSKFAYEEQLLEKMIRTEIKVETMANEIKTTQEAVMDTLGVIKKTVQEFTENLENNITERMIENNNVIEKKIKFFEKLYDTALVNFTKEIENERNSLAELKGKLERPSVAFHVYHVTAVQHKTKEVIIFDYIITNEGSGYDDSTGIFTAPVGGLYQFDVTICSPQDHYFFAAIVHANREFAKISHYTSGYCTCSSVGGVVRVESGERVWVINKEEGSKRKICQDRWRMNTFSGILINS